MARDLAATVIIPTHTHGETLRLSVPTALSQTERDIEILIVGDGVPDVTRAIAADFAAADARVRFFDFPKGPGRGELYRHRVLGDARGEIVCYLYDDDLWMPDHVDVMRQLLGDADFAFASPVYIRPGGGLFAPVVDLTLPLHRMLFTGPRTGFPTAPTCAAHTMALYRRLPFGWRTTPPGQAPDKHMWAQCLGVAGCRVRSTSQTTALIFPDLPRRHWPTAQRLAELREWRSRVGDPSWQRAFRDNVARLREVPSLRDRFRAWGYWWRLRVPVVRRLALAAGRLRRRWRAWK